MTRRCPPVLIALACCWLAVTAVRPSADVVTSASVLLVGQAPVGTGNRLLGFTDSLVTTADVLVRWASQEQVHRALSVTVPGSRFDVSLAHEGNEERPGWTTPVLLVRAQASSRASSQAAAAAVVGGLTSRLDDMQVALATGTAQLVTARQLGAGVTEPPGKHRTRAVLSILVLALAGTSAARRKVPDVDLRDSDGRWAPAAGSGPLARASPNTVQLR